MCAKLWRDPTVTMSNLTLTVRPIYNITLKRSNSRHEHDLILVSKVWTQDWWTVSQIYQLWFAIFIIANERISLCPWIVNVSIWVQVDKNSINTKWASSWDYGTYHIGDQGRLRRAWASAQSRQSLRCSHTWSMELVEGSDQKLDI